MNSNQHNQVCNMDMPAPGRKNKGGFINEKENLWYLVCFSAGAELQLNTGDASDGGG